jgi:hypothetical protein
MNNTRRNLCQSLISALCLGSLSACSQPAPRVPERTYTEEEQRRIHKFRGVDGGEFFISGFGESAEKGVFAIFRDAHGREIGGSGYYWKGGDRKSGNAPLTSVNIEVFDHNGGKLLYQRHLQIADRIPDELLDDLRRDRKGSLRIKVRLHRDGVLLGWDIERRPGFNAQKSREGQYYAPAYSHTGGDFKEMQIAHYIDAKSPCQECVAFARNVKKTPFVVYSDDPNGYITMPSADDLQNQLPEVLQKNGYFLTPVGKVYSPHGSGRQLREKGWYIHPKTGQRIETDF